MSLESHFEVQIPQRHSPNDLHVTRVRVVSSISRQYHVDAIYFRLYYPNNKKVRRVVMTLRLFQTEIAPPTIVEFCTSFP